MSIQNLKNWAQLDYYFVFKGVELSANPEQGIIMSTQSLVLQGVNRNSSGEYTCQESDIFLTFIYRDTIEKGNKEVKLTSDVHNRPP